MIQDDELDSDESGTEDPTVGKNSCKKSFTGKRKCVVYKFIANPGTEVCSLSVVYNLMVMR